jgi:hypothetical protein
MTKRLERTLRWSIGMVVVALGLPLAEATGAQGPGAEPSPVQIANQRERQRIMDLLEIPAIPPGAVSSSPATYDEASANPYPNLPDPLMFGNGRKVTSASDWRRRRAEILEDFQREVYGRTPKTVPAVTWEIVGTAREENGPVAVTTRRLLGRVDNSAHPDIVVNIQATVTTPADATGPVPVIIQIGGAIFPLPDGTPSQVNPCLPPGGARGAGARGAGRGAGPGGRGPVPASPTWQQQVLSRGWGYANINPNSIQADCGAGLTSGIIGLVNRGQPRALDDWGALSAWAWGTSRLLDFLCG